MAIDHIINYDCIPKQTLTTEGIVERLKERQRAAEVISMFRQQGDERPPSQMGFEFTRRTPEGESEKVVIVVQELINHAAALDPLAKHCAGCPANRSGHPFGCIGFVDYPLSRAGEAWLLNQLPVPDEALVWLLLKQGVDNFQYDGQQIAALRQSSDQYFQDRYAAVRRLGEFEIDANQAFEMIFNVGPIMPNHAGILLLFFHGIERDLETDAIINISPAGNDATSKHPFIITPHATDDGTITDLKAFLHALYVAWTLNVALLIDA